MPNEVLIMLKCTSKLQRARFAYVTTKEKRAGAINSWEGICIELQRNGGTFSIYVQDCNMGLSLETQTVEDAVGADLCLVRGSIKLVNCTLSSA